MFSFRHVRSETVSSSVFFSFENAPVEIVLKVEAVVCISLPPMRSLFWIDLSIQRILKKYSSLY
jgi:hypothetical protein